MNSNIYDRDYYERGVQTGKSCYMNYTWMPELTIPMTMAMIDYMYIEREDSVLDYGCAKGYGVKALRMLGREGFGYDISEYAVENAPAEINNWVTNDMGVINKYTFDHCIAKDVFEHISVDELELFLFDIAVDGSMLVIVPLGDNGVYRVPAYALDVTHINAEDETWWTKLFERTDWKIKDFQYLIPGIKDNWNSYLKGNGFFLLER